jgi:hypothetical protein
MPENAAESHQSAARFVGQPLWTQDSRFENQNRRQDDKILHATLILTRAKKTRPTKTLTKPNQHR